MFCFLVPAALATVVSYYCSKARGACFNDNGGPIAAPLHRVRTQGHFWHIPGATFGIMAIVSAPPVGASNLKLVILPLKGPGSQHRKVPGGPSSGLSKFRLVFMLFMLKRAPFFASFRSTEGDFQCLVGA